MSPKYHWLCYWRPILFSYNITTLPSTSPWPASRSKSNQLWEKEERWYQKDKNIQYTQLYYKSLRISDLKIPRNYTIFIFINVNTQMIINHPHLSVPIYFICTGMITRYKCITRAVDIIKNARLMLLHYVVLHYIQRYTCMHQYINARQYSLPHEFYHIFYMCI